MDYYSDFPGPQKKAALEIITAQLDPSLLTENKHHVASMGANVLRHLIDDSIMEGVEAVYGDNDECPGSSTGWSVYIQKNICNATRRILSEKIIEKVGATG